MSPERYFVALVLPAPISDQAMSLKKHFKDQYQSKASLNSPPHITLVMPFEWKEETTLLEALQILSQQLSPAPVELKNFGCFAPRVIFIDVAPSAALVHMQNQVNQFCQERLGLPIALDQAKPFHPHVTLGFRDLKKSMFPKAWEECKNRSFHEEFLADRLSLLKHDGKKWGVLREYPLANRA
jgi:2'-5' RNA ligase